MHWLPVSSATLWLKMINGSINGGRDPLTVCMYNSFMFSQGIPCVSKLSSLFPKYAYVMDNVTDQQVIWLKNGIKLTIRALFWTNGRNIVIPDSTLVIIDGCRSSICKSCNVFWKIITYFIPFCNTYYIRELFETMICQMSCPASRC